jgi:hypothetical protein
MKEKNQNAGILCVFDKSSFIIFFLFSYNFEKNETRREKTVGDAL